MWSICLLLFIALTTVKLTIDLVALSRCYWTRKKRSRNKRNIFILNGHEDLETWPRISIIKPIMTDDDKIKSIIHSFFTIDYPSYDIHFCFQNSENNCIPFINQIKDQFPHIKTYIYTDFPVEGYGNNKILNMEKAYDRTTGEYVWIVDENIQCHVSSIKEIVTQFDHKDVALVHQLPLVRCYDSIEASLNMIYFSTHHSRFVYFCDALDIVCLSGMSVMYEKEKLDEVGGIKAFVKFLSEDFHFANALSNRGYKVKLSTYPAIQDCRDLSVGSFSERMIRWTKLRLNIRFILTFFEPIIHPLVFSLASAAFLNYLFDLRFVFVFIIYLVANLIIDQFYITSLNKIFPEQGELPGLFKTIQAYIMLQVFIIPYIFILALKNISSIQWRGMTYKISWKTIICNENTGSKQKSAKYKRFKKFRELQQTDE